MEIIIGKTAGFCYGVERAVNGAKKELEKNNKVYCLGEIVHNKEVIKELENQGIQFVDKIEEITEKQSTTIIRAHGVPKEIYDSCKKNNIEVQDFTCPKVLKIHKIANEYKNKGFYIILVGARNHPENIGTISYCGAEFSVVEQVENVYNAIEEIKRLKKDKCLLIAQTTYHLGKFKKIKEILERELEGIAELEVKNTICNATEVRQKETDDISKKVEKMIIIGGKNSSNTRKLYEIAKQNCNDTICIETAKEIIKEDFKNTKKVGIMAGASTPTKSIEDVVELLKKL